MNLNKGISTPIAILLIIAVSAVVGVLVWQFTKPVEQPAPKQASDYTTQSNCEGADYYWYDGACHEEKQTGEEQPIPKQASDYTTQSNCEDAGYYWYEDSCHEQSRTADWKIYENKQYGIKLEYPQKFQVEEELVQSFDKLNWYKISFKDDKGTLLTVEVNPDGYGPIYSDRILQIKEDEDNKLVIEKIKKEKKEHFQELINFRTNLYEANNGNTYWMSYKAEKGSLEENLQLFKDFLRSFHFIE